MPIDEFTTMKMAKLCVCSFITIDNACYRNLMRYDDTTIKIINMELLALLRIYYFIIFYYYYLYKNEERGE